MGIRMRLAIKLTLLWTLLLPAMLPAQNPDPGAARIVTEDIGRFWEAFDRASPGFAEEPFESLYLSRSTPGLKDFVDLRIESAEQLAATVRKRPKYYASIRESTLRIADMEPAIRASLRAFKDLYPEAVFPDIYFVIGRMTSGGTTSDRGLLIGAEMFGKTAGMPEDELDGWLKSVLSPVDRIPHIVAHELIHFQQGSAGPNVLLAQSIREGSADFLAELISGRHINHHVHDWADPREAELWREFQQKMHGEALAGWLYGGASAADGRPADLGYWMGYKITKAYYDRAEDKREAIREILQVQDFDAFLKKSGYAEKFSSPPSDTADVNE